MYNANEVRVVKGEINRLVLALAHEQNPARRAEMEEELGYWRAGLEAYGPKA